MHIERFKRKNRFVRSLSVLALSTIGLSTMAHAAAYSYDMVVTQNAYTVEGQSPTEYGGLSVGSQVRVNLVDNLCGPTSSTTPYCFGYHAPVGIYKNDTLVLQSPSDYEVISNNVFTKVEYVAEMQWVWLYFPTVVTNGALSIDFGHLLSIEYHFLDTGDSIMCPECHNPSTSFDFVASALPTPTVPVPPAALMFLSGLASLFTRRFWRSIIRGMNCRKLPATSSRTSKR